MSETTTQGTRTTRNSRTTNRPAGSGGRLTWFSEAQTSNNPLRATPEASGSTPHVRFDDIQEQHRSGSSASTTGRNPSSDPPSGPPNPPDGDGGDPDDGSDPDDNPDNIPDNVEPPEDPSSRILHTLASISTSLAKNQRHPKSKPREPETFDGTDPRKLNTFITQCTLYFRAVSGFSDDIDKINFALSYLRGTALDWFEPMLLEDDVEDQLWMYEWLEFIAELRRNFGTIDPVGEAEDDLERLSMRDGQRILKYNVEFNRLAVKLRWDDRALRHRYYKGLPDRIKDEISRTGKPATLLEMKNLAQVFDARHWERSRKKSQNAKTSDNSSSSTPSDELRAVKTMYWIEPSESHTRR